jgi:hypothetical protein
MNTTLREALAEQINQIGPARFDVDELVGLGEQRLRRRKLIAALGAAAAVVLVIALAVGGAMLSGSTDHGQEPTDTPRTTDNDHEPNQPQARTRPLVYSDVHFVPGHADSMLGDPIHVGDRVVETGSGWIHMDVTDEGVVYSTGGYFDDGRVWFTDGGTPKQIGSHACPEGHGWPGTVVTGNSGSLAAWIDCTRAQDPELVVFDTGSGREVVRRRAPGGVHAIIGDHVYLTGTINDAERLFEFDMATDRVSNVKLAKRVIPFTDDGAAQSQSYLDDIRSHPRGLVIGDSWETGTPTLGGEFNIAGRRLVPIWDYPMISVFDTVTRRPIRLHLPARYEANHVVGGIDFGRMQWLDDDTVALEGTGGQQDGDILTCRLSSGRCALAVPDHGQERVVPGQGLW